MAQASGVSLRGKLNRDALNQSVQYVTAYTEQTLGVNVPSSNRDFANALQAEQKGALTQFSPKVATVNGVSSYNPALPQTSVFVKPTTINISKTERMSFSEDMNLNRREIELANINVIRNHIINLSNGLYNDKERMTKAFESVKALDVYSIETSYSTQQEISAAIKQVDNIINTIHAENELPAFLSASNNALYLAIILNFMSVERLVYAINWLYINSETNVTKFYNALFKTYDKLRKVAEMAELDSQGNLVLDEKVRFHIVSIAHFFERIRYVQKTSLFNTLYSQESQDSLKNIILKIQSNQQ